MAYDSIIQGLVEAIWYKNRNSSVRDIRLKCVADRRIGDDCPSPKTISNWINYDFKPKYKPLGAEEDNVIDPWSEREDGTFDSDRIKTLTVLTHVASKVMDQYGIKDFAGFTKRQADWACKLKEFFNLSNQFEALVLLLFTFQFSQKERFELETSKPTTVDRSDQLSQALMSWVWWDPSSEKSVDDPFYPWEYGEQQTTRMVALASGLIPDPIDVSLASDEPLLKYERAHAHINTRKSPTPVPEESADRFGIPDTEDLQNIDDYDWNNTA